MNRNKEQVLIEKKTLEDRAYDLLGERIALRDGEAALKALEVETQKGNTQEIDDFLSKYDQRNRAIIEQYFRKQKNRKLIRKTIPKFTQMVVLVLGMIFLVGGIATATSRTFRVRVMELLFTIEKEYTSLSLRENTASSFDVPVAWQGNYYPSFLPDGVEIQSINNLPGLRYIEYVMSDTKMHYIYYVEHDEGTDANVDTEDAEIQPILIRGNPGLISLKDGQTSVMWTNEKNYFLLILYANDKETALKIAQSIISIK